MTKWECKRLGQARKQPPLYLEVFHSSHYGLPGMHNTGTSLLQMFDNWLDHILLDLSAAFNVVVHRIFLGKLEMFGMAANSLTWFDRSQKV